MSFVVKADAGNLPWVRAILAKEAEHAGRPEGNGLGHSAAEEWQGLEANARWGSQQQQQEAAKRDEGRTHAKEGQPRRSAAPSSKPPSQDYAQGQQQGWAPSPLPGKMMGPTRIRFVSGKESGGRYDQLAEMEECWTTIRWNAAEAANGKVKAVRELKLAGFEFATFFPEQWRTYADYERMACNEYQRVYDETTKTTNTVLAVQIKALRERRENELSEGRHLPPHNDHIASVDRRHETPDTSNSGLRQEPLQEVRVEPERTPTPPPQQEQQEQGVVVVEKQDQMVVVAEQQEEKGDGKQEVVIVEMEKVAETQAPPLPLPASPPQQQHAQEQQQQSESPPPPPPQQQQQLPAVAPPTPWPPPSLKGSLAGLDGLIARLVPPSPACWWGYKERSRDESHGEPDGSVSERAGIGTGWSCSSTFMGWGCESAGRRRLAQLRRAHVREK